MLAELRRAFKILFGLALIGLILIGYRNWLGASDTFQIRKIEISGNEILTDDEILNLAGIESDKRIWDVSLSVSESGIRNNPFVADAEIRRDFPDILKIHITEKRALALLKYNKKFYAIDDSGLVLPSKPGRLYDMPVISGNIRETLRVGKKIHQTDVTTGLGFLKTIVSDSPNLYKEISEVLPDPEKGLVLYTSQKSIPVYMGETNLIPKIRCLDAVLSDLGNQLSDIRYIDLRFQGQVILGKRT